MLRLDHVPFLSTSLTELGDAFAALGFTVSPPGAYVSPDFPKARWPTRGVFLRDGWFDLRSSAAVRRPGPFGCLFRTNDLEASGRDLADLQTRPSYRLERAWNDDVELPRQTFRLFELRERVAPLGLAVIEHVYPCQDMRTEWMDHPNGAVALAGLTFGASTPGPAAGRVAETLDLATLDYLSDDDFTLRYGDIPARMAIAVGVGCLDRTSNVLARSRVPFRRDGASLVLDGGPALGCAFEFRGARARHV